MLIAPVARGISLQIWYRRHIYTRNIICCLLPRLHLPHPLTQMIFLDEGRGSLLFIMQPANTSIEVIEIRLR